MYSVGIKRDYGTRWVKLLHSISGLNILHSSLQFQIVLKKALTLVFFFTYRLRHFAQLVPVVQFKKKRLMEVCYLE